MAQSGCPHHRFHYDQGLRSIPTRGEETEPGLYEVGVWTQLGFCMTREAYEGQLQAPRGTHRGCTDPDPRETCGSSIGEIFGPLNVGPDFAR